MAQVDESAVAARLRAMGQEHVLRFAGELTPEQRQSLLEQVASIDLGSLPGLIQMYVTSKPKAALPSRLEPTPYYPADAATKGKAWDRAGYAAKGKELVRAGKVAAFTVAGGQGTRLGYDGPKGCYPAGAVTGKPLFGCLADWILAAQQR